MNDERRLRIGRNEVLFREINERLNELQESFDVFSERADFVCECGDVSCAEQITMSLHEYEQVRADPELFAIKPDHEIDDVEQVVAKRDGYDIVRKDEGAPAALARAEDPRSDD
jgi:hypothetical protein